MIPSRPSDPIADLQDALDKMGLDLPSYAFERASWRVAEILERNGRASETQIRAIVEDAHTGSDTLRGVAESFR